MLCMPLVLNVTPFITGCIYVSVLSVLACLDEGCLVCDVCGSLRVVALSRSLHARH